MKTLSKQTTSSFFKNPDGFFELQARWKTLKNKTAAQHLIYAMLRGKNLFKAFTPPTNEKKVMNGHIGGWCVFKLISLFTDDAFSTLYPERRFRVWDSAVKEFADLLVPEVRKLVTDAYFGDTVNNWDWYSSLHSDWVNSIPRKTSKTYTYIMVNSSLPVEQKIIQASHATYLAGRGTKGDAPHIVLGEAPVESMIRWERTFKEQGVPVTKFHDLSPRQLTAFCTDQILSEDRKPYKEFPLMRV